MTQKVIKIGSSVGVTIPRAALKDLRFRVGEHVEVTLGKETRNIHRATATKERR